ncbi:hypothetical protein E2C01_047551 [Portunus trituberculatus]|uniref:Uncharacterized protein n=1 Tax=Portunus trituberculatus TaxID=210409 RepID=A0A5B7G8V3_PORTR|nr:hypothetical protein [Portunus trituberculatus]
MDLMAHQQEAMMDMMAVFSNKVQQLATKEELTAVMGYEDGSPRGTSERVHRENVHSNKVKEKLRRWRRDAVLRREGGNAGGEYGPKTGERAKSRLLGKEQND